MSTIRHLSRDARETLGELGIECRLRDDGTIEWIGDTYGGEYDDPAPTVAAVEEACEHVADAGAFRDSVARFEAFHDRLADLAAAR